MDLSNIKNLVKNAFDVKKEYGASSQEFIVAQREAMEEVDRILKVGGCEIIPTGDRNELGQLIGVRIEKKGEGFKLCSYVKTVIKEPSMAPNSQNSPRIPST